MDNKAPLYPHWTRTHVLAASVSIIAVYLGMRLLNNLLALPAGYALPLFPPAGVGLTLAAAGGMRVLPAVAIGAALAAFPLHLNNPALSAAGVTIATLTGMLGASLQAWLGADQFRRHMRPGIDTGRDVVAFPGAYPAGLPDQRVDLDTDTVCAGRVRQGNAAALLVLPGGRAIRSACCCSRRCAGSSAARRGACGGGARRWSRCRS
ncbi:hypothetical protein [Massilia sp. Se16.2.3]|uniref:hypothetical protein n=1 Tax=Massilia sp. Se16.2.3 TaxID=2709303 RepID=UPI00160131A0|nr:hypothetical protein [Massilia sp. Se16.2.3]QNA97956.1 hypothetical protein G4G31_02485 [Massilia sp. Se16.2.3]